MLFTDSTCYIDGESMDKKLNAVMTSTKYLCQKTERHLMEINLRVLDTEKLAEFAKEISEESYI